MKTYELDSQFHLAELTVNKLAQKKKAFSQNIFFEAVIR